MQCIPIEDSAFIDFGQSTWNLVQRRKKRWLLYPKTLYWKTSVHPETTLRQYHSSRGSYVASIGGKGWVLKVHRDRRTSSERRIVPGTSSDISTLLFPFERCRIEVRNSDGLWMTYCVEITEEWPFDVYNLYESTKYRPTHVLMYHITRFYLTALHEMASRGWYHGDIKLENTLFRVGKGPGTFPYEFILCDLEGLGNTGGTQQWRTGRGTSSYMRPNYQSRTGPDSRDDAFAVSVCLLKLYANRDNVTYSSARLYEPTILTQVADHTERHTDFFKFVLHTAIPYLQRDAPPDVNKLQWLRDKLSRFGALFEESSFEDDVTPMLRGTFVVHTTSPPNYTTRSHTL